MASPAEILTYAADRLESGEWRWAQGGGDLEDGGPPAGCFCAETALRAAALGLNGSEAHYFRPARLVEVAAKVGSLWRWNDRPGRTLAEVVAAMRAAARRPEAQRA